MSILVEISDFMQKGKSIKVKELVPMALEQGIPAKQILDEALLHGMGIIGEKFKNNEIFVPEVLVAARAMNAGTTILKPHLAGDTSTEKGVAVIGTVKGDLHDIGKNLVKMMLEGKGITVHDLGVDVPPEVYIAKAKEHNASIICCSALLTTTMNEIKNVVDAVKESDLAGKVTVMIGGAPVTQDFCDKIGADCYTVDAAAAADAAIEILSA